MSKIAVLGDRDSVLGSKALGLDVVFCESADIARKAPVDVLIVHTT